MGPVGIYSAGRAKQSQLALDMFCETSFLDIKEKPMTFPINPLRVGGEFMFAGQPWVISEIIDGRVSAYPKTEPYRSREFPIGFGFQFIDPFPAHET